MSVLSNLLGSKPTVPKLPSLNLTKEQSKAIEGNLEALPQAQELATQSNQFSREQIRQMLQSVIPGYDKMTNTATGNIQDMLEGKLPSDVSQMVQNSGAAKALGSGTAGTGMARNLVARDLGLTSLDMTQKGLSAAESWIKMSDQMYSPGMLNLSSMFITPMQQAGFDVTERNTQFERQWLQNQISAMPDPMTTGLFGLGMQAASALAGAFGGVGISDLGMGLGGMGGGGSMPVFEQGMANTTGNYMVAPKPI